MKDRFLEPICLCDTPTSREYACISNLRNFLAAYAHGTCLHLSAMAAYTPVKYMLILEQSQKYSRKSLIQALQLYGFYPKYGCKNMYSSTARFIYTKYLTLRLQHNMIRRNQQSMTIALGRYPRT